VDTAAKVGWASIDLEHALPDPALLPPLEDAVAAGSRARWRTGDDQDGITPRLVSAVAPTWPYPAEDWTVAGSGEEGVVLGCRAVARPGDVVAVAEPTDPLVVETLRAARIRVIPVPCDDEGPDAATLALALARHPAVFVDQPRARIPTGLTVSAARMAQLARVLAEDGAGTVVLEYDALGPLATAAPVSLGAHLPERVVHVRSYCPAYGPELRSCVVAGPARLVERVRRIRRLGTAWAGRVLQDAQAFLIDDPDTDALLRQARTRYAGRREALAQALRVEGVPVLAGDGLGLWVPVADETRALMSLAAHGVSVAPGSRCYSRPPAAQHLYVTIGCLPDDPARARALAGLIAAAARGGAEDDHRRLGSGTAARRAPESTELAAPTREGRPTRRC
jgi:DNA-binding transcriptional MocR family regulator